MSPANDPPMRDLLAPQTEAGQYLAGIFNDDPATVGDIIRIEAESARREAALREEIEALPYVRLSDNGFPLATEALINRAAVLALLGPRKPG